MSVSKAMIAFVVSTSMSAQHSAAAENKFAMNVDPSETKFVFSSMSGEDLPTLKLCSNNEVTILLQLKQRLVGKSTAENSTERAIADGECIFVRSVEVYVRNDTTNTATITTTLFD